MKRYFTIITIAISTFLGLASCSSPKEEEGGKPEKPEVKAPVLKVPSASEGVTAPSAGGEVKFAYSIENPVEGGKLGAEASETWVDVDVTSDKNNIVLDVKPNEGDARTAVITVKYSDLTPVKVTLSQLAAGEEISISQTEFSIACEGSEEEVVTVTSDRDWTLSGGESWVTASAESGKSGDKVTFKVEANDSEEERTAEFMFACASKTAKLTFVQAGKPALDIVGAIKDKSLKALLLENADLDKDGVITPEEAEALKELVYEVRHGDKDAILSLDGLEYFTGLEEVNLYGNEFTSADFSMMPQLKSLDIAGNQWLDNVNLAGCTKLERLSASFDKSLVSLDIRDCASLKSLVACAGALESLDVSGCPALESMTVYSNKIVSLDLSANTSLVNVSAGQESLESIVFPASNSIEVLSLGNSKQISEIDLTAFPALRDISLSYCPVKTLVTEKCPALETIDIQFCKKITSLDVSKNLMLKKIQCYDSGIQTITMFEGQWESIQKNCFGVSSYMIKTVPLDYPEDCSASITDAGLREYVISRYDADGDGKISGAEAESAVEIVYSGKGLTSFDGFRYFRHIAVLDLSDNELESIELGPFASTLTDMNLKGNKLSTISFTGAAALRTVNLSDNRLTAINDVAGSNLEKIERIEAARNKLTKFDCAFAKSLKYVDVTDNELTEFNIQYAESVEEVYVAHNNLSENTSSFVRPYTFTSLKKIDLSYNNFMTIYSDVTWTDKWLSLESFNARGNAKLNFVDLSPIGETLTYIDVRECPRLDEITVSQNSPCQVLRDENTKVVRK